VAAEVAKIIGGELGWSAKERAASVKAYEALAEQEEEALNELVNS
jgi:glycerol-3-phosphate dehydrogenase